MELIYGIWDTSSQYIALVVLVEALANALALEFRPYVPHIIPRLLQAFKEDTTDMLAETQVKVLGALVAVASNMEEYLNLVVPVVISLYGKSSAPKFLRKRAIESLPELSSSVDLLPYTSRIVHSLVDVMATPDEELFQIVLDAIGALAGGLGPSFVIFVPMLLKVGRNLCFVPYSCLKSFLLRPSRITVIHQQAH